MKAHVKGSAFCHPCCDAARNRMLDRKMQCHRNLCSQLVADFIWRSMADVRIFTATGTYVWMP